MTLKLFENETGKVRADEVGNERTKVIHIADFFNDPDAVVEAAQGLTFARINQHYPGVRAPVQSALLDALCSVVSEHVPVGTSGEKANWQGAAWYSIVTCPPAQLTPFQRLPHFDGFDEAQVAVMIYLNHTDHGGTAFFRHRATGFERITEARYPAYKQQLERGVAQTGLPPARYITDGAPHFEKIGESDASYNSLIIYPGTLLHSGVIRNDRDLDADPVRGRLTINGFFSPVRDA